MFIYPCCVQVDAALDLSHTQNIGRMIKTHFPYSQFIVVSLKEGMFSNANVLFRTKFMDGVSTVTRTANDRKCAHRFVFGQWRQFAGLCFFVAALRLMHTSNVCQGSPRSFTLMHVVALMYVGGSTHPREQRQCAPWLLGLYKIWTFVCSSNVMTA